jgi:hypothetical protein
MWGHCVRDMGHGCIAWSRRTGSTALGALGVGFLLDFGHEQEVSSNSVFEWTETKNPSPKLGTAVAPCPMPHAPCLPRTLTVPSPIGAETTTYPATHTKEKKKI